MRRTDFEFGVTSELFDVLFGGLKESVDEMDKNAKKFIIELNRESDRSKIHKQLKEIYNDVLKGNDNIYISAVFKDDDKRIDVFIDQDRSKYDELCKYGYPINLYKYKGSTKSIHLLEASNEGGDKYFYETNYINKDILFSYDEYNKILIRYIKEESKINKTIEELEEKYNKIAEKCYLTKLRLDIFKDHKDTDIRELCEIVERLRKCKKDIEDKDELDEVNYRINILRELITMKN